MFPQMPLDGIYPETFLVFSTGGSYCHPMGNRSGTLQSNHPKCTGPLPHWVLYGVICFSNVNSAKIEKPWFALL